MAGTSLEGDVLKALRELAEMERFGAGKPIHVVPEIDPDQLGAYKPPVVVPDANGQRPTVGWVSPRQRLCGCAAPVGRPGERCGRCGDPVR